MTKQHPAVPEHLQGTYLGMASDPVIDHLVGLGVTAVELMPVHQFAADRHLVDQGLTNYWGYNSIAFFAPHTGYATGGAGPAGHRVQVDGAGPAPGRARGHPRRGVQPHGRGEPARADPVPAGHRQLGLLPTEARRARGTTSTSPGTGNSLNILHPRTMALIMDSLRYWVTDMHVDGFRFDLAPVLVRGFEAGQPSAFFEIIQQDPVLSTVKLIAEPWDVGPDGYQLGRFPPGWSEWNGAYRDCVRKFWRGDPGQVPELASRLTGSSDIYAPSGRRTYASVNFVTCHDGFTLTDLVSYEERHNEANGEDNRGRRLGQPQPELGSGGIHRLGPDPAAAGPDEAEPPGHADVLPGGAHAARRGRVRADPAGQQQRLLPGQRDQLGQLGHSTREGPSSASSCAS